MKLILTSRQYNALCDIYGPPENVHYMLMTSTLENSKWVLEDNQEVFSELLETNNKEIAEGFCSAKNAQLLFAVCKKIDPASLNWICF